MSHVPEQFPPYAFIPGRGWPHPKSDLLGHSRGLPEHVPSPLDEERWETCPEYLRGFDLFDAGYYWEAHEMWESLWLAQGRHGRIADVLKALIKLAAAGVKVRQGQPHGVITHSLRASALLRKARSEGAASYLGLNLDELVHFADEIARIPPGDPANMSATVARVFQVRLRPVTAES